jgi:hypothetical protein
VYIIIGEKKLLRTNNLEARACGGMREGEIRCGEGGDLWAGRTKEDGLEGLEEIGKGFEWTRKAVVEKNGRMVMCLYKTTLFSTYKYSYFHSFPCILSRSLIL